MSRQFLFRMQNQEAEQKRTTQPDFKIRSTEHQRFTSNAGLSSSTMYQRPNQLQMNEYEGENMTSLHAKLHQEADKIRKWKVQTELEIKEKDKKLTSATTQIETMKKSLLELQLDNERLSSRMQEEIDDRQEVMQKVSTTRELCQMLKSTATSLDDRILRCETEKTELKYAGREISQHFEELSNKFGNLRLSTESNHKALVLKYEVERDASQKKENLFTLKCEENLALIDELETNLREKNGIVSELQAVLLEKNNTLERLNESLAQLEQRNEILEKDLNKKEDEFKESAIRVLTIQEEKRELEEKLQSTEADFHSLGVAKEKMSLEMTESCAKFEHDLLSFQDNVAILERGLEDKQNKLMTCQTELQETLNNVEQLKSSRDILTLDKTELDIKIDLQNFEISNLRTDVDERKEEIHRLNGEIDILMKKLDRENLCKMQFQEAEKDLEAKICVLKLEKDEQSQTILRLEETLENKENEVINILSKERDHTESLQADIRSKEKELGEERTQMMNLNDELNRIKGVVVRKDSELLNKNAELDKFEIQLQEQKTLTERCQQQLEQASEQVDELKKSYEEERTKADELNSQLKDLNTENKEHGKSLTSQHKKFAAVTKHNKELEKEVKSLKAELNAEMKKNTEKDKSLNSLEEEMEEWKQRNDNLDKTKTDLEKEMKILRAECKQDKKASEDAIAKAKKMQEIAKKETGNAKALTECQLTEMMGTLDSYKQSSEKILADKDAEVRSLKNKLEALEAKKLSEQDKWKDEKNKLGSSINVLSKEKDEINKQFTEIANENEYLKQKIQDLEDKQMEFSSDLNKSQNLALDSPKPQTPPVAPVTPQKQQTIPWTMKTPKTPRTPVQQHIKETHANANNASNVLLRTPQRSILRAATNSVSKRRKVAFLPDDDVPSSSDELMELGVDLEDNDQPDKYRTPLAAAKCQTPRMSAMINPVHRMTPKRGSTPISKPLHASTPRKPITETSSAASLTSILDKPSNPEPKLKKPESNTRTPNVRNGSTRKTSKFFKTSPKDKAASRTLAKEKAKKEEEGQLSWFDLDSVYGFGPED